MDNKTKIDLSPSEQDSNNRLIEAYPLGAVLKSIPNPNHRHDSLKEFDIENPDWRYRLVTNPAYFFGIKGWRYIEDVAPHDPNMVSLTVVWEHLAFTTYYKKISILNKKTARIRHAALIRLFALFLQGLEEAAYAKALGLLLEEED